MPRRLLGLVVSLGLLLAGGIAAVPGALAGGGCHAENTGHVHNDAATSVVRMDICSFEPTVTRVPLGGEVRFLNTSSLDHLVLGRGQSWGSADTLRPGAELTATFREAGVFPYSCPLHPGMVGAIVAGDADTPPAAVGVDLGDEGGTTAVGAPAPTTDEQTVGDAGPVGIDPALAMGLGGLAGGAVLALGALLLAVRRRAVIDPVTR